MADLTEREEKVLAAMVSIAELGVATVTEPGIARLTGINRHSVPRLIDHLIEKRRIVRLPRGAGSNPGQYEIVNA